MADLLLEPNKEKTISLSLADTPTYTTERLDDLSNKYDVSLGDASPGVPSIASNLMTGNEARLQELARRKKDIDLANTRNDIVMDIANSVGSAIDPTLVQLVQQLGSQDLASGEAGAILEEGYAKALINRQLESINQDTGAYDEAIKGNPQGLNMSLDMAEDISTKNIISSNLYEEVREKYDTINPFVKGIAWATNLVPLKETIDINRYINGPNVTSLLPGERIAQYVNELQTLHPAAYKAKLSADIKNMVDHGQHALAMQVLQATMSFSDSERLWGNVWAGVDAASLLPVGLLKGSKAVTKPIGNVESVAKTLGDEALAARAVMETSLKEGKIPSINVKSIDDVERVIPAIARPAEAAKGASKVSPSVLNKYQTAHIMRANAVAEILKTNRVGRLTDAEYADLINNTKLEFDTLYPNLNSNIIDIVPNAPDNVSNIYSVSAKYGQKNGKFFPSKESAQMWAGKYAKLKSLDYDIVNEGTGWSVSITRNIDETKAGIRDFKVNDDTINADGITTTLLHHITSPDLKLSPSQRQARSTATIGIEKTSSLLEEFGKPFAALQKDKNGMKDWNKFIKFHQSNVDPVKGRGLTFDTPDEFIDAWQQMYNKMPTYEQIDAWDAWKQFYDLRNFIEAADYMKQKAILGIEKFSARRSIGKGSFDTLDFEGKEVPSLPTGKYFSVAVLDEKTGQLLKGNNYNPRYNPKARENIQKLVDDGYRIVQPFKGSQEIEGGYYNFIVMKDFSRGRVTLDLPPRNGGRPIQKYNNYGKMPIIKKTDGRSRYIGDVTLFNARDAEEAKFIAQKFDEVRDALRTKGPGFTKQGHIDFRAAKKKFQDAFPMWDFNTFLKAVKDGKIDLDAPIVTTKSGQRTTDVSNLAANLGLDPATFKDFSDYDLSRNVKGKPFGDDTDLDLYTLGVEKGAVFEIEDSVLNPLEALKLSMGNMVEVNMLNDYKLKSVRDFTTQFGDILEYDNMVNDFDVLFNPTYKKSADPKAVKTAESIRHSILSILKQPTWVDRQMGAYKEKIVRSLRTIAGDSKAEWVGDHVLPLIQNGDVYLRKFAFHTKFAFNPKQIFLQASQAAIIMSISPKFGAKAAALNLPMIALSYASKNAASVVTKRMAKIAGVKEEELAELTNLYKSSGFDNVGGSIAYIDDLAPPKLVKGAVGQVLDVGTSFFNTGERYARRMAFATAYLERKSVKGTLGRSDEAWILNRAKDLTGSMTRDSNASYQRGWTSVLTQFMGYHARMAEMMVTSGAIPFTKQLKGAKLTPAEGRRLFIGMSAFYGVPVASGMTFGVIPIRDMLKEWMVKEGIEYDNTIMEPFIDGFASTFLEMITGTDYDISEQYGPGGLPTFYDLLKGDSELTEILMGASGGIIYDTLKDSDPLLKSLIPFLDPNDAYEFPPTVEDLIKPFKNISIVNNASKLWIAHNTGMWKSKNLNNQTSIELDEAIVATITGIVPERISDAFTNINAIKAIEETKKSLMDEYVYNYKLAVQAARAGNTDEMNTYRGRASALAIAAGLTAREISTLRSRAIDEEPLDASVLKQLSDLRNSK